MGARMGAVTGGDSSIGVGNHGLLNVTSSLLAPLGQIVKLSPKKGVNYIKLCTLRSHTIPRTIPWELPPVTPEV